MSEKIQAEIIIKKAQEDFSSGKISRRDFNSIMMTFGAIAGYTLFTSFASAWTGTRMRKSSGVVGTFQVSRSLRFRSSATAFLSRTPGTSTSYQKGTISLWCKKATNASANRQHLFQSSYNSPPYRSNSLSFETTDQIDFSLAYQISVGGGWNTQLQLKTNALYRDPAAWYHIVVSFDTTQAIASDRAKMWVNGEQITSFATATYPTQNDSMTIDTNGYTNFIGDTNGKGVFTQGTTFDGYICEAYRIDGQALTAASFGQTDALTNSWVVKKYSGTYGANGFYLPFNDTSSTTNLVKDSSGNSNNWTANNISLTAGVTYDSMTDVPLTYGTTDRGNFCTLNPLSFDAPITISAANLNSTTTTFANWSGVTGTMGVSSGKWYWETTAVSAVNPGTEDITAGIQLVNSPLPVSAGGYAVGSYAFISSGSKVNNSTTTAYGTTWTNGDVIGVALDLDAGTLTFYKNGTSQGVAFSSLSGTFTPAVHHSSYPVAACNFGQRPFSFSVPSGHKALHTGNLETPTILKPNQYFDVATYTGTSAARSVSTDGNGNNLMIAPDLVWVKSRSSGSNNHVLFDTSRGVGNYLMSSATNGEINNAGMLTAFNSNGFSAGVDSTTAINGSGLSLVAWMWKKGVTPGFDIVTYTGDGSGARTIPHSLGVVPKLIIVKNRSGASSWNAWQVYHASLASPANSFLRLNETANYTGYTDAWNNTLPTSTNFSVRNNTGAGVNGGGDTFVAYLFAEVNGFSKFGSYTGNGSVDGPFVHCGFKSRWIMFKRTDASSNWQIYDTARERSNRMFLELSPNSYESENSLTLNLSDVIDITSTGFKFRSTGAGCELNVSGATYVFVAFAEVPFKYATAR